MSNTITQTVWYRTINVEGLEIFYREAGPVLHPERVTAMIVQNGDAHAEAINKEFLKTGLSDYWEDRNEKNAQVLLDWLLTIEGTKWHYLHGVRDPSKISPDNWAIRVQSSIFSTRAISRWKK